jgi:putative ABC transport system ATP-binding protein
MIELVSVTRDYGNGDQVPALANVSLSIASGDRVAIMGPSGSGKSTLLHLICGLDRANSGQVKVEDQDLSLLSDDARTALRREKIGMIFQTFNLLPTLTAIENVALPLRLQRQSRRLAEERAAVMLDRVGLGHRRSHFPDMLSGGERQRVAIARALVFAPPLLLGDEPTGNLDSASAAGILDLLSSLQHELGTTLLLVTHDAQVAASCQRIVSVRDGRIVDDRRNPSGERP